MDRGRNGQFSMAERVEWSELPKELWPAIGKSLQSSIDVLRFRSTCKSWRSSVLPTHRGSACFHRRIITPLGEYSLTQTTIYRLEPSDLIENLSMSSSSFSKGWLMKVEESKYGHLCLLDPFTNSRLSNSGKRYPSDTFPKVLNLLNFRVVELVKAYSIIYTGARRGIIPFREFGKAVLFPNFAWTEVENCRVFSINQKGKLGFSKTGDDKWTLLDEKNFYYDDIIVHKGQLYVVDKWGTISWIDCSSLKLVQFSPPLCGFGKKKHLVESGGSLYVVDMYVEGEPNNPRGTYYEVVDIKVYKLDEEWGRWLDVKSLGERVFVLSKDCNFSLSAQDYHGCEANCIYFCCRGSASVFSLESSTFNSPKVFWPCSTLFNSKFNL